MTAPVSELDVVLGKYLGALAFYAALWAPTLLYVILLRAYAPAGIDAGPIVAGYLGTLLVGAGALALGLFASTLTRNQIVAAVLSFVALAVLLLVGALGDALVRTGALAPLLRYVDLFRHMEDFGRGIVDSRRFVYHLSLVVLGLYARRARCRRRGAAARWSRCSCSPASSACNCAVVAPLCPRRLDARPHLRALGQDRQAASRPRPAGRMWWCSCCPRARTTCTTTCTSCSTAPRARRRGSRSTAWTSIATASGALTVAKRYNVSADDVTAGVIIVEGGSGPAKFIPETSWPSMTTSAIRRP